MAAQGTSRNTSFNGNELVSFGLTTAIPSGAYVYVALQTNQGTPPAINSMSISGNSLYPIQLGDQILTNFYGNDPTTSVSVPAVYVGYMNSGTGASAQLTTNWSNVGGAGNAIMTYTAIVATGIGPAVSPVSTATRYIKANGFIDNQSPSLNSIAFTPYSFVASGTGNGSIDLWVLTNNSLFYVDRYYPGQRVNFAGQSCPAALVGSYYVSSYLDTISGVTYGGSSGLTFDRYRINNCNYSGVVNSALDVTLQTSISGFNYGPSFFYEAYAFNTLQTSYGAGQPALIFYKSTAGASAPGSTDSAWKPLTSNGLFTTKLSSVGGYDTYAITSSGAGVTQGTMSGTGMNTAVGTTANRGILLTSSGMVHVTYTGAVTTATGAYLGCTIQVTSGDTTFSGSLPNTAYASFYVVGSATNVGTLPYINNNYDPPTSTWGPIAVVNANGASTNNSSYKNGYVGRNFAGAGSIAGSIGLILGTVTAANPNIFMQFRVSTALGTTGNMGTVSLVPQVRTAFAKSASANVANFARRSKTVGRVLRAIVSWTIPLVVRAKIWGRTVVASQSNSASVSKIYLRLARASNSRVVQVVRQNTRRVLAAVSNTARVSVNRPFRVIAALSLRARVTKNTTRQVKAVQAVSATVTRTRQLRRGAVVASSYKVSTTRRGTFGRRVVAGASNSVQATRLLGKNYLIRSTTAVTSTKKKVVNLLIPVNVAWNMAKNTSSKLLIRARGEVNQKIFVSSNDWSQPNNGQPTPGTGPEIFDDIPEEITQEDNPLGTDIVPFHE
jgi:hypothetical protein